MKFLEWVGKPLEWIVLVAVLTLYMFMRAANLPLLERFSGAVVSAGMAYAGSSSVAKYTGENELLAAILIMTLGPLLVGTFLTMAEDQAFLKNTLQAWVRKRLGLEGEDNAE